MYDHQYLHAPSAQVFVIDPASSEIDHDISNKAAMTYRLSISACDFQTYILMRAFTQNNQYLQIVFQNAPKHTRQAALEQH